MASAYTNGANGVNGHGSSFPPARFSKVPPTILVAVAEAEGPYDIEISLDEDIQEDPTELCTLLENEHSVKNTWMTVAIAYAKHKRVDVAIEVLSKTISVFARGKPDEKLSILNGLCWLYLLKCRGAPRVKSDGKSDDEVKTKDYYIQAATSVLNDASRISPSYGPLFLARGVLYLLRASLAPPSTSAGPNQISSERMEALKSAQKCFQDALRQSGNRNLMAKLGMARVNYSWGKYTEALKDYQSVLERSPELVDPDPRIGIGCCYWQLGHKNDAASAWQRSLELNPNSKIAKTLLGLYNIHLTSSLPASDPKFVSLTKKAIVEYIAPSLKVDNMYPLTCAALSGWYNMRKESKNVETLSRRAIELTDVNDIASDGWYQLARKEHQGSDKAKAMDYYTRSDRARGGDDRGYIPAKFGAAQMRVLNDDYTGAKFRLEKIIQQQPNYEALTLLGTLYAEDVFAAQAAGSKEDKSNEMKKALKYLEDVSKAWKDPRKNLTPDNSVLLMLARLYEAEHPEKSLKCLEEVERLEREGIPEEDYPTEIGEDTTELIELRKLLPPQLLNNMGCFHYQAEHFPQARELFETALKACVAAEARDETIDTDALVTSISYNLARTYESEGMVSEAKGIYESLLARHADYVDARIRLAYITLRQNPTDEGPKAVTKLYEDHKDNLEVRALMGWYISKSKKKTLDPAADPEQRHYKHTLQGSGGANKHNQYALTGLGNIFLGAAREMRGSHEQEKEKRNKTYERAVEFFEKVLQVDPKNAYAAQGIAIALAEHKKDYPTALQIFSKVKETLKDHNVLINLGHIYCELKQWPRAIENYEAALAKDRAHDPTILACLGRVWQLRGRLESNLSAMKTALEYSMRALEVSSDNVHFKFNVAYVQMQIAQIILTTKPEKRALTDVEAASTGLDEAIQSFIGIAKSPQPPYPAHEIEQRANMGKNTMRRQMDREIEKQKEYEMSNKSRLEEARAKRDAEIAKREAEKKKVEEEAAERKRKIAEEQERLRERDREMLEKRADEERRRQELIDDSEMRRSERSSKRSKGGKRKKKGDMDDSETEGALSGSDGEARPRRRRASASGTEGASDEERPRQKKRKLERKKKAEPVGKYKSSEFIDDSDDEDLNADLPEEEPEADTPGADTPAGAESDDDDGAAAAAPRPRKPARIVDEDEEEDEDAAPRAKEVAMDDDEDE